MGREALNLKKARVLISNDDGVHAPGLKLLEKAMRKLAKEVWVVAPETEQSAASHSLTLRRPLRIRKLSGRRFAVDGTPTDAVLLGVNQVMQGKPPDLVLSGVNRGGNLGEDVTYSGTVAAAMEGTLLGFPSVALSLVTDDRRLAKWSTAEHWVGQVIERLCTAVWPENVLINVNFPDVPAAQVKDIEVTVQGRRKIGSEFAEGRDPRGEAYFWIGAQRSEDRSKRGTDLEAVSRGAIAVTPLCLDLTHRPTFKSMQAAFA
ncbi:MAG: 5'/3'-nucleotidase SurE [Rhodospirillales bacterium]